MQVGWDHVIGVGQIGVLLMVYFRLGGVVATLKDHGRRIIQLERQTRRAA